MALLKREDRRERDLPVTRVGETFGREFAGADQADDVLAGKAEPGGGLSRGEELFLAGDGHRDWLALGEHTIDLLGHECRLVGGGDRRVKMQGLFELHDCPRILARCSPVAELCNSLGKWQIAREPKFGGKPAIVALPVNRPQPPNSRPPRPWYPESVATTVDPENKAQAPEAGFLTVVVDADEYEKALLDPRVHQTNLEATEFLERLEREGRSL